MTRTTAVKPVISIATYSCDQCGRETYEEITAPTFMPRIKCESDECKASANKGGRLHLVTRGSKFEKFQELRVQELVCLTYIVSNA